MLNQFSIIFHLEKRAFLYEMPHFVNSDIKRVRVLPKSEINRT